MPHKRVIDEIERLLNEIPYSQEVICIRHRELHNDTDRYYTSLSDVPANLDLTGNTKVTAWTKDWIFFTEIHDTWPNRMGKARRNPP